jgi:hypothetical protein
MSTIDEFKHHILVQKEQHATHSEVNLWLRNHGINVSERTLARRLKDWGFQQNATTQASSELISRIDHLFHRTMWSDSKIASQLSEEFSEKVTENQVQEIRLKKRWLRRTPDPAERIQRQLETKRHVHDTFHEGSGRSYGIEWMRNNLRRRLGHRARQEDVRIALRQVDPIGVERRRPGLRRSRLDNYITDGPNHVWCIDGHDKLSPYGIQIYAAVDACSRKIIWWYCGTANRAQFSVLKQYLDAVSQGQVCPNFLRADKGAETLLAAEAHLAMYVEAAIREGWSQEELLSITVEDCFIWGPSVHNVKTEKTLEPTTLRSDRQLAHTIRLSQEMRSLSMVELC